ncbi:threonine--tRNA ligase [Deferribacterales bacterium RsTz2092]|nr:threonine--tRNA ligase [Deferribacterales bacterium]
MVNIILPDGKNIELTDGATAYVLAETISKRLAQKAIAAEVNSEKRDLSAVLKSGDKVRIIAEPDADALDILRHSTAHLMANAVQNIFKDAKVTIGPVINDGFYYDFDYNGAFSPEDLEKVEAEMVRLATQDDKLVRSEVPIKDAVAKFAKLEENFKVELIEDLARDFGTESVSLYTQGAFTDLCRGPHVPSTGKIKHFKLLSVAGAYWRGDEKNKMLQRIYGTAFFKKEDLDAYLNMLEEAKRRDHRKLGKQLGLFMFDDEIGAGFPLYLPRGGQLRATLEEYERHEHLRRDYKVVYGPVLLKKDVWVRSGHYDNYRENMYFTEVDNTAFGIKPMNCVNHIAMYKSELRSYRDLPIRMFELGHVHRHEKSGALHGLMRVRAFTQDDAHLFCREDQLEEEIGGILDLIKDIFTMFGFEFTHAVATRPEKYVGTPEIWDLATKILISAMDKRSLPYTINEGDGAFYGPKIDVLLKDAIGRTWQCSTIQCDFNLPERFDISYIAEDGAKKRPVMLHRTILGSIDRFIGVLIEHFTGAFPFWLAPEQVRVMNITDGQAEYAKKIANELKLKGFRIETDLRNEKINFKIREAQLMKVPHMVIVGKSEQEANNVSIRLRNGENKNSLDFLKYIDILGVLDATKTLDLWR